MNTAESGFSSAPKPAMGFWKCWSMSVGVMIGSGVFLLPATLAPYGSISFLGWLLTSLGAIVIALTLGRLAGRTDESGGFYVYGRDAFGPLVGFILGWSYWLSNIFAVAAISVAFAGYTGQLIPDIEGNIAGQIVVAAVLIWVLTGINVRGVAEAASLQLITTVLKILPLVAVILLGFFAGSPDNVPAFNPKGENPLRMIAATALLTMWAFVGIEAATVSAEDVRDPKRTIPRAVVTAALTTAAIYIAATAAVMFLVPAEQLAVSEAPFSDAARMFGAWGPPMVAVGALISMAGSANGCTLLAGQMPMAAAQHGHAPQWFAKRNRGHAPGRALIFSGAIATALMAMNYSGGLQKAFTFLIAMSTLSTLLPYLVSALAELRVSMVSAKGWAVIAILAAVYSIIAIAGAGLVTLGLGVILIVAGAVLFFLNQHMTKVGSGAR